MLFFEQLVSNPRLVLEQAFGFLGLPAIAIPSEVSARKNTGWQPSLHGVATIFSFLRSMGKCVPIPPKLRRQASVALARLYKRASKGDTRYISNAEYQAGMDILSGEICDLQRLLPNYIIPAQWGQYRAAE